MWPDPYQDVHDEGVVVVVLLRLPQQPHLPSWIVVMPFVAGTQPLAAVDTVFDCKLRRRRKQLLLLQPRHADVDEDTVVVELQLLQQPTNGHIHLLQQHSSVDPIPVEQPP